MNNNKNKGEDSRRYNGPMIIPALIILGITMQFLIGTPIYLVCKFTGIAWVLSWIGAYRRKHAEYKEYKFSI